MTERISNGNEYIDNSIMIDTNSTTTTSFNIVSSNSGLFYTGGNGLDFGGGIAIDPSFQKDSKEYKVRKHKEKRGVKKVKGAKSEKSSSERQFSPVTIFKVMKKRLNILEIAKLNKRLEQISKVLDVVPNHQIALREDLEEKAMKVLREAEMASCGFTKFIEKDILDKFISRTKNKVIKATKIKNYGRFIPAKAQKKMAKAQKKLLFDGYVIIHTDPDNTAHKQTVEEKKDPILCGVIKESDRFYFIADWVDELCDLTFDTIIDKLGLGKKDYEMDSDFGKIFSETIGLSA